MDITLNIHDLINDQLQAGRLKNIVYTAFVHHNMITIFGSEHYSQGLRNGWLSAAESSDNMVHYKMILDKSPQCQYRILKTFNSQKTPHSLS